MALFFNFGLLGLGDMHAWWEASSVVITLSVASQGCGLGKDGQA